MLADHGAQPLAMLKYAVHLNGANGISIEGREPVPGQDALHRQVSSDYFRAVGIGLREGRRLEEWDGPQSAPVTVINETMARQFWPNENALGKRFKLGPPDSPNPWLMIVGIAKDHNSHSRRSQETDCRHQTRDLVG